MSCNVERFLLSTFRRWCSQTTYRALTKSQVSSTSAKYLSGVRHQHHPPRYLSPVPPFTARPANFWKRSQKICNNQELRCMHARGNPLHCWSAHNKPITMTAASPASPSTSVSNGAASTTVKTAHNFEITCPLPLTKGNSKNLNLPSQLTPINRRRRVSVEVHEVRNIWCTLCCIFDCSLDFDAIICHLTSLLWYQITSCPTPTADCPK